MFLPRYSKILLAALVAGTSILSANTYGQQRKEARFVIVGVDCNDDEQAKAILDYASIDAKKDDEAIFIIARLGTGEASRRLNRRRLYAPRHYLIETRG